MHLIKIKGTDKIPDFIQIRDNEFKLIAYFSMKNINKGLERNNLLEYAEEIEEIIANTDFYKIVKLEDR